MDFHYTAAILRMAINMAALTDKGRAEAERALNELLILAQAKAGTLKNPQPDPCVIKPAKADGGLWIVMPVRL